MGVGKAARCHAGHETVMSTTRLTVGQAVVRYLINQRTVVNGQYRALFGGVFAIFGHGNVAGLGAALAENQEALPTFRAHNEQAMAHAAIAFAKANNRRQMLACTTSVGPGATNMVTAAALAHVNRLPVLFLPGDTFATRRPDPVLQQIEHAHDPTITANDCFRPVSRYWDRIVRPEQLLTALPAAIRVLTDPAECGPATVALPQDVQSEAFDFPEWFFEPRLVRIAQPVPDPCQVEVAAEQLRHAERPLIVAGGGVHCADACEVLGEFARKHAIPVAETQAGKGALPWDHPLAVGGIGVTGTAIANELAAQADVVLAVGTRLSDITTGSRALFSRRMRLICLNVAPFDAHKHRARPVVGDARRGLQALSSALGEVAAPSTWRHRATTGAAQWQRAVDEATRPEQEGLASDAQVLGAVNRFAAPTSVVVSAAGGLAGELHKLWRCTDSRAYHVEYGYSCMGYEIAGGLGVKMAHPDRDVYVLVGDGSYLMLNSEIATSVMLDHKLIVVVLDNRGFGCIDRLQRACGGRSFNNLLETSRQGRHGVPQVDFAAHAASLGALSESVANIAELTVALARARAADRTYVIVIDTDPRVTSGIGGAWWDVPVAQISADPNVQRLRAEYERAIAGQNDNAAGDIPRPSVPSTGGRGGIAANSRGVARRFLQRR
jgi:3D-(3,5/4)-trihydroxycyclohexane-1,2-dione acylhydrolase (decyclizing)